MSIIKTLEKKILVYDGAMGTMLQGMGLEAGHCPEDWILSHPEKIKKVHQIYADAGSDIVETNTFGANRLALARHGLEGRCDEINKKAVELAKEAKVYVAGSVGPLPEMTEPLGRIGFDEALSIFKEQVNALVSAGVDLILFETFSDIKELKIAVIAAKEVSDIPIQAQLTYTTGSVTISGTPPETGVTVLEGLGVNIIGVNCSLGPKGLLDVVKRIAGSARADTFISVLPNAGMPKIRNGQTYYDATPKEMSEYSVKFMENGANLIGGCCGTTPEHIKAIAREIKEKKPVQREERQRYLTVSDRTKTIEFKPRKKPYIIGERINPSRRKKLKNELVNGETKIVKHDARQQVESGAELLDVNINHPEIDEIAIMEKVVNLVQQTVSVPLVIDSPDIDILEAGLKECAGKPIINSVNGEKDKMKSILDMAGKYGAAVIALAMDDKGIPMEAERRINIAKRIIDEAEKRGLRKEDVLVDLLTLSSAAQPGSADVTLEAVDKAKKLGWQTVLGISNISFGLPGRDKVNNTFLAMAVEKGLTAAIVNPMKLDLKYTHKAEDILKGKQTVIKKKKERKDATVEEKLYDCIINGDKDNIVSYIEIVLERGIDPFEVNQSILIPALEEVGDKFESKEYFLPQLLMSAEAMQEGVERLEKSFPEEKKRGKAKILMATVKGDLHDIGKNIVCSVLKNYGYDVFDLGKNASPKKIVDAVKKEKVDIVGLSSLMTTTMGQMEKVVNEIEKYGLKIPVIVGGAVVTPSYARKIKAAGYANNAVKAVNIVKGILGKKNIKK